MAGDQRSRTHPGGEHRPMPDEELSMEEIIDRYVDRWVLMRVTGHDEDHWPNKGYVIETAATPREADAVLERMIAANPKPKREGRPLYAFWAYPEPTLAEFEAFLQECLSSAKQPALTSRGRSDSADGANPMPRSEGLRTRLGAEDQLILGDELTIEEVIERHRNRWVVMRVTGHDEDHWPAKGYVLVSAQRQQQALDELERLVAAHPEARRKGQPLYSFLAQPDIRPGPEFDAFLRELLSSAQPSS